MYIIKYLLFIISIKLFKQFIKVRAVIFIPFYLYKKKKKNIYIKYRLNVIFYNKHYKFYNFIIKIIRVIINYYLK